MFNITEDVFYPESFCESTISSFSWCHTVRICITCQMSCASLQNEIWLVQRCMPPKTIKTQQRRVYKTTTRALYMCFLSLWFQVSWSLMVGLSAHIEIKREKRFLQTEQAPEWTPERRRQETQGRCGMRSITGCKLSEMWMKGCWKKQLNWLFNRFNKVDNVCHRRFIHKPQLSTSQLRVWLQAPSGCSSSSISRRNIPLHFYAIDRLQPLVEDKK